jgi:transposase
MNPDDVFIGIDVSKARLDLVVRPTAEHLEHDNTPEGISLLGQRLQALEPNLIVCEASGGYERALVAALTDLELPIVVVNARQVRDFAKAIGQLAKTDALDAMVLARFAEAVRPEVRALPDANARAVEALVTRRRQVVEMIVMERNRLSSTAEAGVGSSIKAHIAFLETQRDGLDGELLALVERAPELRALDELLRSVPGVGPVLSVTLIAGLPELGCLSSRKLAALVGVAPLNRDSGTLHGKRGVWGGRAEVRAVLYMATFIPSYRDDGTNGGSAFQPGVEAGVRAVGGGWEGEEGGVGGVHEEALDDFERGGAGSATLGRGVLEGLTNNTTALAMGLPFAGVRFACSIFVFQRRAFNTSLETI